MKIKLKKLAEQVSKRKKEKKKSSTLIKTNKNKQIFT